MYQNLVGDFSILYTQVFPGNIGYNSSNKCEQIFLAVHKSFINPEDDRENRFIIKIKLSVSMLYIAL